MQKATKWRTKLGELCLTYVFVIGMAGFVLPYINGNELSSAAGYLCAILMFCLALASVFLLRDSSPSPTSKWKRIKVKKDTTIHIQEEEP